jgi:hypothetical protein
MRVKGIVALFLCFAEVAASNFVSITAGKQCAACVATEGARALKVGVA